MAHTRARARELYLAQNILASANCWTILVQASTTSLQHISKVHVRRINQTCQPACLPSISISGHTVKSSKSRPSEAQFAYMHRSVVYICRAEPTSLSAVCTARKCTRCEIRRGERTTEQCPSVSVTTARRGPQTCPGRPFNKFRSQLCKCCAKCRMLTPNMRGRQYGARVSGTPEERKTTLKT